LDATANRLSTGKRVNSALDGPNSFFTARSLTNRASDLNNRKDSIGQAISLLEATDKSLAAVTSLVEQAKAKAQQADEAATGGITAVNTEKATTLSGATTISTAFTSAATAATTLLTEVGALTTDFQSLLNQINALIGDAGYKGTNLLKGSASLDVKFNVRGDSKLTISGTALEIDSSGILSGLKFTQKAADYDFTTAGDITAALADVDLAITELRTVSSTFGTSLGIIQTREDFTKELVNALESGAGKLVNASLEEESAKLLALQTRQALGIQSLAISNQSQQSILALFR
jgi:flagellin-like hook-associated protein FlgL